ncbi:MAG: hypothetical protein ING69_10775 [Rhodocyclaceae bacterium]|nr:hypothetical protein [Rhodocyclaceae bacterium]
MFEGFEMLKKLEYIRQFFGGFANLSSFSRTLKPSKQVYELRYKVPKQSRELRDVVLCGIILKATRGFKKEDKTPYLRATISDKTDDIEIFANHIVDMNALEKAHKEQLPVMLNMEISFIKGSVTPILNLRKIRFMYDLAESLGAPVVIDLKDGVSASNVIRRIGDRVKPFNNVTGYDVDQRGIVVVLEKDFGRRKWKNYKIEDLCVGKHSGEKRKAILDIIANDPGVERVMTEGRQHVPASAA